MRIGERSLDRVLLTRQRLTKLIEAGLEWFESTGIERAECLLAANERDRRALLRSGLGEVERAALELEPREDNLGTDAQFGPGLAPPKPARDHQMNDEKHLLILRAWRTVESEHDAFADPAHVADQLVLYCIHRRIDRAEHERT